MNRTKQTLKTISPVLVLLLAVGCAKYDSEPLPRIKGKKQEVKNIQVNKKILNEKETRSIFGKKNSLKLSKKGYQTIILNIKNKSDKNYILDSNDMNLKIEDPSKISKMLHRNTSLRVASWCAGGLLLWPCFIGAAIDGPASKSYNKDLNKDIDLKAIYPHEEIKIKSNEKIAKLIFVNKKSDISQLNLKFIEKKDPTQSINFIV